MERITYKITQYVEFKSTVSSYKANLYFKWNKVRSRKFNITFNQPSDFKGQPQHEIIGGKFMITLNKNSDDNLYLWARKSNLLKSGVILFQTDLGMTVYEIGSQNAYCINLTRSVSSVGGSKISILVSPETLTLNGIEHNNFWKQ